MKSYTLHDTKTDRSRHPFLSWSVRVESSSSVRSLAFRPLREQPDRYAKVVTDTSFGLGRRVERWWIT